MDLVAIRVQSTSRAPAEPSALSVFEPVALRFSSKSGALKLRLDAEGDTLGSPDRSPLSALHPHQQSHVLVPGIDMANHSFEPSCHVEFSPTPVPYLPALPVNCPSSVPLPPPPYSSPARSMRSPEPHSTPTATGALRTTKPEGRSPFLALLPLQGMATTVPCQRDTAHRSTARGEAQPLCGSFCSFCWGPGAVVAGCVLQVVAGCGPCVPPKGAHWTPCGAPCEY